MCGNACTAVESSYDRGVELANGAVLANESDLSTQSQPAVPSGRRAHVFSQKEL
jgi:hypothetical protein